MALKCGEKDPLYLSRWHWGVKPPEYRQHGEMMAWGNTCACNGKCCRNEGHKEQCRCRCGIEWGGVKLEV